MSINNLKYLEVKNFLKGYRMKHFNHIWGFTA